MFWKGALTIGVTTAVVECICARLEAFVMGIFDWPITKKKLKAFHSPKTGMLQSLPFQLVI